MARAQEAGWKLEFDLVSYSGQAHRMIHLRTDPWENCLGYGGLWGAIKATVQ